MRRVGDEVTLRAMSWRGERPVEGDFLRTPRGRCYQIVGVREPGPRATRTKLLLDCVVLEDGAVEPWQEGVYGFEFEKRTRRRTR